MNSPAQMNTAQMQAVHCTQAPCLVLAGAGSGKTRVITHKMAHLIHQGMRAEQIAAITFTNKAAAEMRDRVKALVGRDAKNLTVCTFHALGVRLLREDGAAIGMKANFSILDSDDVQAQIKDAGGTTDAKLARQWQWTISRWKNEGLTPAQAEAQAADADEVAVARVMARYQERLQAYQAVDFDDLIGLPVALLQKHDAVRQRWQQQLAHILVDEYQDTNATQYELLRLLVGAPDQARFTCVGDDDQSIYGWRGATLDNLKRLPEDYPRLRVIKLEQNYRSTNAILRAANAVIGPNPKLYAKTLFSELGEGEPVRVVDADTDEHEAERVVARIQSIRAGTDAAAAASPEARRMEWRDFAVLYRANHQARVIEQALRKAQMPYRVSGGTSFFDRAEIRDLTAWLRLWANNDDDPAFLRAVATPKRGIGHQTLQSLGQFASSYKLSLFEALFSPSLGSALSARAVGSLHEFGRLINDLEYRARHATGHTAAVAFLADWLKDIGYERHLHDTSDDARTATTKWQNVLEFADWMAKRCGTPDDVGGMGDGLQIAGTERTVLEVAQTVALLSTLSEREQDQNAITLSTLHAAKGLEWPHVTLVGINEGLLPFKPGDDAHSTPEVAASPATQERIQEERRLMYVGITRAQHTLAVSWCKKRKQGRDMVSAAPSRFIAEMKLDERTVREDPREKLKALRAEFAKKAAASAGS